MVTTIVSVWLVGVNFVTIPRVFKILKCSFGSLDWFEMIFFFRTDVCETDGSLVRWLSKGHSLPLALHNYFNIAVLDPIRRGALVPSSASGPAGHSQRLQLSGPQNSADFPHFSPLPE